MAKLTARSVEVQKTPGRYGDGKGLQLVVTDAGTKKWVLRYQVNGQRRDMGLGSYPDVTLAAARDKAEDARRKAKAGEDPIEQRRAARKQAPVPSFDTMAKEVIALEQAKSTNEKVRYQWELLLGPRYCADLSDRPVNTITTSHVEKVLRPVWHTKPETARKLHRRIRRVFEHARIRLRDSHGIEMRDNPARWDDLKALGFEPPTKLKRGRHPSLAHSEIPAFMSVLSTRSSVAARALQLLILTAVRTDAVRRAEWSEFDLDAALWTIPVDHLKDKRTRTEPMRVPLAEPVVTMLREQEKLRLNKFVFPGQKRDQSISNMAMTVLLRKMSANDKGEVIWKDVNDGRPIVPHGFRATFRTWAEEETNCPRAVVEQAMGHQVGTEVERAYLRTDVLEKRRSLMADWVAWCKFSTP